MIDYLLAYYSGDPMVDSSVASRWTLKRRSNEMELVRDIISKGSPLAQLQHEVTTLTKMERESLLDSVMGSENSVEIPADEVLAMKADLSLTWSKLRVLRRSVTVIQMKYKVSNVLFFKLTKVDGSMEDKSCQQS